MEYVLFEIILEEKLQLSEQWKHYEMRSNEFDGNKCKLKHRITEFIS